MNGKLEMFKNVCSHSHSALVDIMVYYIIWYTVVEIMNKTALKSVFSVFLITTQKLCFIKKCNRVKNIKHLIIYKIKFKIIKF